MRGRHEKGLRSDLLYRETSGAIIGAFYSVYSELGHGFLEGVYANSLAILLTQAGLRVERQVPFEIRFHGESVGYYRADLVVEGRIVVEVKSGQTLIRQHVAQLLNYLRASRLQLGLLLSFGEKAEFKRVVWTEGSSLRTRQQAPRDAEGAEGHGEQL